METLRRAATQSLPKMQRRVKPSQAGVSLLSASEREGGRWRASEKERQTEGSLFGGAN